LRPSTNGAQPHPWHRLLAHSHPIRRIHVHRLALTSHRRLRHLPEDTHGHGGVR
jgi:hypothetical protein